MTSQPDHGQEGARTARVRRWRRADFRSSTRLPSRPRSSSASCDVWRARLGESLATSGSARAARTLKRADPSPALAVVDYQMQHQTARRSRRDRRRRATACNASRRRRLRVIPLGGLDEIGKNMTVLEYGDDMVAHRRRASCSPTTTTRASTSILPDYTYILEAQGQAPRHRHHARSRGPHRRTAVPAQGPRTAVPVLGTKLTLGLITRQARRAQAQEAQAARGQGGGHVYARRVRLRLLRGEPLDPGRRGASSSARPWATSCTPATSSSTRRRSTGGSPTSPRSRRSASDGVTAAHVATRPTPRRRGITRSEAEVGIELREVISEAEQRVIVASFSSHIHRIQQVCDAAVARRPQGRRHGPLDDQQHPDRPRARLPQHRRRARSSTPSTHRGMPPEKVVVLCTGSQGEPLSALARMANGDHRTVHDRGGRHRHHLGLPGAGQREGGQPRHQPPVQGRAPRSAQGRCCRARVRPRRRRGAQAHAQAREAALLHADPRRDAPPRRARPTSPRRRHVPHEDIFVLENGDCLEIDDKGARLAETVEPGVVYVDGLSVGDVGQVVLRDRQQLAQDGIATVVVAIDAQTGTADGRTGARDARRRRSAATDDPSYARPAHGSAKTLAQDRQGRRDRSGGHQARGPRVALAASVGAHPPPADDHPRRHGGLVDGSFWAVVLGVVQGIAEFLPISSDGHLTMIPWLFGLEGQYAYLADVEGLAFDIALHAGSFVAILLALWPDWVDLFERAIGKPRPQRRRSAHVQRGDGGAEPLDLAPDPMRDTSFSRKFLVFLLVTSVPGALIGVASRQHRDVLDPCAFRWAPVVVGICLIVFGVLLWAIDRFTEKADPDRVDDLGQGACHRTRPGTRSHPGRVSLGLDHDGRSMLGPLARRDRSLFVHGSIPIIGGATVVRPAGRAMSECSRLTGSGLLVRRRRLGVADALDALVRAQPLVRDLHVVPRRGGSAPDRHVLFSRLAPTFHDGLYTDHAGFV